MNIDVHSIARVKLYVNRKSGTPRIFYKMQDVSKEKELRFSREKVLAFEHI